MFSDLDDGLFLQTHRFIITWLATRRGALLLFTMTAAWPIPPAESSATQSSLTVLYSWLLLHLSSSFIIYINTSIVYETARHKTRYLSFMVWILFVLGSFGKFRKSNCSLHVSLSVRMEYLGSQ